MPVIYPEPGQHEAMARVLLSMVDDPHSIGVVNEGGLGFVVSDELEQLWLDSLRPPQPQEDPVVVAPDPAPAPEPLPQRRTNRKKE